MKRPLAAAFLSILIWAVAQLGLDYAPITAQSGDQHGYFNSLVARADHWKSYSLRSPAQLADIKAGGYAQNTESQWVSYDPSDDTDRHKQDAVKVIIPSFDVPATALTKAISAVESVVNVDNAYRPWFPADRVLRIDSEIVLVKEWLSDTSFSITRGALGTVAGAHAAGAGVRRSTNSLRNQVRLPLLTDDGHTYLFTWDGYWTDSYLGFTIPAHKAFQFSSGGRDGDDIWLEPQTAFNGGGGSRAPACYNPALHAFVVRFRSYNRDDVSTPNWAATDGNQVGPGVVRPQLGPMTGEFCAKPNQWVRFWVRIDQRANDYDYVDAWAADETQEPIQLLSRLPISVRPTGQNPNQIKKFWLEFNASEDEHIRLDQRDLVAYVRNFVALRDVADLRPLLVRPVPGAKAAPGPAAPTNVRIIS